MPACIYRSWFPFYLPFLSYSAQSPFAALPPAPMHLLPIPVMSSLWIRTHDNAATFEIRPNAMHSSHRTYHIIQKQELVDDITCEWRGRRKNMTRGMYGDYVPTDHLEHEESRIHCIWGDCNGRTSKELRTAHYADAPKAHPRAVPEVRHLAPPGRHRAPSEVVHSIPYGIKFPSDWEKFSIFTWATGRHAGKGRG